MANRTQVDFRALTISVGPGKRELDQKMGDYRRKYTVTVVSDATGLSRRFTFTDSIANERAGKVGLAGDELLYAFRCFVEDAAAGERSFDEFAADYGYDLDSHSARQTFRAFQASRQKFRDLWHSEVDPYAVLEELSALGVE